MIEVWAEKYRPKNFDDFILVNENLIELKNGFPNVLFYGEPGCGKTTLAKIITKDYETLYINGSDTGRLLETFREEVKHFCSTVSINDLEKVVFIDEADNLTIDTQMALRSFIENTKNVKFVITANYIEKIIEPLQSRFTCINMNFPSKYTEEGKKFMKIIYEKIKSNIDININEAKLKNIIFEEYPDIRSIYNTIQSYNLKCNNSPSSIKTLIDYIIKKDYLKIRGFIESYDYKIEYIFSKLYNYLYDKLDDENRAKMIIILNEYQYKDKFVFNRKLNLSACILEIITTCF